MRQVLQPGGAGLARRSEERPSLGRALDHAGQEGHQLGAHVGGEALVVGRSRRPAGPGATAPRSPCGPWPWSGSRRPRRRTGPARSGRSPCGPSGAAVQDQVDLALDQRAASRPGGRPRASRAMTPAARPKRARASSSTRRARSERLRASSRSTTAPWVWAWAAKLARAVSSSCLRAARPRAGGRRGPGPWRGRTRRRCRRRPSGPARPAGPRRPSGNPDCRPGSGGRRTGRPGAVERDSPCDPSMSVP